MPRSVVLRCVGMLLVAAVASGCGSCGSEGPAEARPADVPPPEGILAETWITGTGALLRGLAEQSRSELVRQMLPKTAGDLASRLTALPATVADRVPATAALYLLTIEHEGEVASALALELPRGVELGPGVPLVEGGPDGSRFLLRAPGASEPAQVLAGEVIVWAESRALLERVLPYVRAQLRHDGPPAARVRVPDGVAGGPLRRALEAKLDGFVEASRASLREERARHDAPPALGDPEVLLDRGAAELRALLAYLPDVGAIEATITASPSGTALDATAAVREGSPLGRALAARPAGPAYGLAALPQSTALAVSTRRVEAGAPAFFELVRVLGGERIDAASDEALRGASEALTLGAGEPSVIALGGNTRGAFVLYARATPTDPVDAELVTRLFAVPYVAELAGALEGCDGPAALGPFTDVEGLDVAPLCARTEPPYPALQLAREPHALVLGLSTQPDPGAVPHPAVRELAGGLDGRTDGLLGADPDAARALEALDDQAILGVVFLPSRAFAALGLFDLPVMRRMAEAIGTTPSVSPTVLALRRADAGLGVKVRVAPRGIDRYVELGLILARVLGGPTAAPAAP